jgi:hypothetical protein
MRRIAITDGDEHEEPEEAVPKAAMRFVRG